MRQAITTKWFGPTNFRGSRVKASADAGSVTVPWDYALSIERNHERAAEALAVKLGWTDYARYVGGSLPGNNGYAFVIVPKEEEPASITARVKLARVHTALWADGPDTEHGADTLGKLAEIVPFGSTRE